MTFIDGQVLTASQLNDLASKDDLGTAVEAKVDEINGYNLSAKSSADIAASSSQTAQTALTLAQTAASAAEAKSDNSATYADTATGISATTSGQYFRTPGTTTSSQAFEYWLNSSGVAVLITSLMSEYGANLLFDLYNNVNKSFVNYLSSGFPDGVLSDSSNLPLMFDGSSDPKVIMALNNQLLDLFCGISYRTMVSIEEAAGRDPRLTETYDTTQGTPMWWDNSTDPKVALYLGADSKVYSPGGFGNVDGGLSATLNDYVNSKIRALLYAIKLETVTNTFPNILFTGHSWADYIATPQAMRNIAQAEYGDGGLGYVSFNPTVTATGITYDQVNFTQRTLFDAVTADGTGINGQSMYTTGSDAVVSVSGLVGTKMTVYYQDLDGLFKIQTDAGVIYNIVGGNTNKFTAFEIDLAAGTHFIRIDTSPNTSGGKVNLFGVKIGYSVGTGVSVFSMGHAGSMATDYTKVLPNYADVIPVVAPDCVLIILGTNEANNNQPIETYKTALRALINNWKANVNESVGISLISAAHTIRTDLPNAGEYVQAERDVATELNIGYVDGYNIFPGQSVSNEISFFANRDHLNDNGAKYFADRVINRLLEI